MAGVPLPSSTELPPLNLTFYENGKLKSVLLQAQIRRVHADRLLSKRSRVKGLIKTSFMPA